MSLTFTDSELIVPTGTQHTWVGRLLEGKRYRVEKELGRGGMGTVLLARDAKLDMPVVIKVPHAMLLNDAEFAARFRREIKSLVTLSHPHIVKITDVGEHEGLPFAVMQYLDGGSLEGRLSNGPMSLESLSDWLPDVARALDFIHREGFVHRDIKPANILFDREGHAYVSDFGIAKAVGDSESGRKATAALTGAGMVLGTAEYMAPELVMGETFDHRVDQYALAVTVYEVLSGQTPFRGPTAAAIMVKQTAEVAPDLRKTNAAVSAPVAAAVSRALSKQPDGRFATCGEFAAAVVPTATTTTSAAARNSTTTAGGNWLSALACPQCGRELRPGPKHAGKVIRCPGCQTKLQVSADVSQLAALSAISAPTSTTALPMMTGLNPSPTSMPQFEPIATNVKSLRASSSAWLPWSMGSGVAALLVLSAIWFLRPADKGILNPGQAGVQDDPGSEEESSSHSEPVPSEITNRFGIRLKLITAGSFRMGCPATEVGRNDEQPQHQVEITRPFFLGIYEVTQGQWESVMGTTPWKAKANVLPGKDFPATYVSWGDATEFCRVLTGAERLSGDLPTTEEYRLPTEAEWEYACRARTTTAYSFGSDAADLASYAWFDANAANANEAWAHEVGQKLPNAFGLYDMHGNVWEWCADWKSDYSSSAVVDPQGPSTGSYRVYRGGSWVDPPGVVQLTLRYRDTPDYRQSLNGFRLARSSIR